MTDDTLEYGDEESKLTVKALAAKLIAAGLNLEAQN